MHTANWAVPVPDRGLLVFSGTGLGSSVHDFGHFPAHSGGTSSARSAFLRGIKISSFEKGLYDDSCPHLVNLCSTKHLERGIDMI